jgi:hypothetical protein
MKVPALVGMAPSEQGVVMYVDDVDVAVRGGPKGASSSMLATIRNPMRHIGGRSVILVMTATDVVGGDRTVSAMAKAVDLHLCLLPGRDEVVQVLRTVRPMDDAEALADCYNTDIRAALLAEYTCDNGADDEQSTDCGATLCVNASSTRAHVCMEADATLLEAAGVGGDAACSDLLVWMAEEYRKNFSRCV